MTHKWEHEDEYFGIMDAMERAQQTGNTLLYAQLQARMAELDAIMWQSLIAAFTELTPYQSIVDALRHKARHLGVAFPNLTDPHNFTGDGQFNFGVSDDLRTVQIWPRESRGCYSIDLFDYANTLQDHCYQGDAPSLEQATRVLSLWFVERATIADVHAHCPWMSREPFQLTGPRVTFE